MSDDSKISSQASARRATVAQALVLLSGGMDSVAALHWASAAYAKIAAVSFDYGQPNRDAELYAAQREAEALGVSWERLLLNGLPRAGLLRAVTDHDETKPTNPAFVPGRNLVFLTLAAGRASGLYPNGNIDLIVGACQDDARGFPDCRAATFIKLGEALRAGMARQIAIVAPWVDRTKTQILQSLDAAGVRAAARSWSCYRADGPCGSCTACVVRARAFDAVGLVDEAAPPTMTGGDGARQLR